jgi:hypothetical protein
VKRWIAQKTRRVIEIEMYWDMGREKIVLGSENGM